MQLKDKLDLAFTQSTRSFIIKVALEIVKFVVVIAAFYLLFFVCNILSVFRPAGVIPDSVVNVIFVIIQLLSLLTCTVGLVEALYTSPDNKVLLTFPVSPTSVYVSKLLVYFVFELKKNFTFTLPVFLAYGIINGAVWYYYIWAIICFIPVSLLPVAIGAVISIPAFYVMTFVKNFRWLRFILILVSAAAITYFVVGVINLIPENINLMGQWGTIFVGIQNFLTNFSSAFLPYYYITKMIVGGTLKISSDLFSWETFLILAIFLVSLCAILAVSFLLAKPFFVKMASRQFEFEKTTVAPRRNHVHKSSLSPYFESLAIAVRSTDTIISTIVQLVLPGVAILLLNTLYAAMNTNYTGQTMTKVFNFLVMLILSLSLNNGYSSFLSREGAARNLLKTRPISPVHMLVGRLLLRILTIILSVVGVVSAYLAVSDASRTEIVLMCVITMFVSLAHLMWCAELDVMHSDADQYATAGMQYDSPNETKATIIGFLLSALFAFFYYFFSDRGTVRSLVVLFVLAVIFLAARAYLFFIRTGLYFVEN